MTLQELIGELLTLSNAYPPETPVHTVIPSHGYSDEIVKVITASTPEGVHVEIHSFD